MNNDWPDPPQQNETPNDPNSLSPILIGCIGCGLNILVPTFTFLSATRNTTYTEPFVFTFFLMATSIVTSAIGLPKAFTWKHKNAGMRALAILLTVSPMVVALGTIAVLSKITGIVLKY